MLASAPAGRVILLSREGVQALFAAKLVTLVPSGASIDNTRIMLVMDKVRKFTASLCSIMSNLHVQ